ncbi:MAG: tetratricopeptide repeat protein [Flavobacteriales bacterium]|nr:tetratricopeptide repeat protein [Flavobacteriales bacterium]
MRHHITLVGLIILLGCDLRPVPKEAGGSAMPTPVDSVALRLADLDRRIVDRPDDAGLYAERARLFQFMDSSRRAIRDWERALELDSSNADFRMELGSLYYTTTLIDRAREQFQHAIALAPEDPEAKFRLAEIELVRRDHLVAMKLVNEALRIDPNLAHGYYLKGWIHKELGDTALAISSLRTAIEQDAKYYEAFVQLGILHAAKRDHLAREYYKSALALKPDNVEAWYNLGMYYQESGQDSLALETYARMAEIDSMNPLAPYNSGFIRLEYLGATRAAVKDFTKALDLNTNYYQAWYNRGVALERLGSLDSAAADYQVALAIHPNFDLAAEGLQRLASKGAYVKLLDERKRKP